MLRPALLVVPLIASLGLASDKVMYRWVDRDGNDGATDDLTTVPAEYRKQVKREVWRAPAPPQKAEVTPEAQAYRARPTPGARLRLLVFLAEWCKYCREFEASNVLKQTGDAFPALEIRRVQFDTEKELVTQYRVAGIPRLVLVGVDGAVYQVNVDRSAEGIAAAIRAATKGR